MLTAWAAAGAASHLLIQCLTLHLIFDAKSFQQFRIDPASNRQSMIRLKPPDRLKAAGADYAVDRASIIRLLSKLGLHRHGQIVPILRAVL